MSCRTTVSSYMLCSQVVQGLVRRLKVLAMVSHGCLLRGRWIWRQNRRESPATLFLAWVRQGQLVQTRGRIFCYLGITHAVWLSKIVLQRQCSNRKPLFVDARPLNTLQRRSGVLMLHALGCSLGLIVN